MVRPGPVVLKTCLSRLRIEKVREANSGFDHPLQFVFPILFYFISIYFYTLALLDDWSLSAFGEELLVSKR